MISIKHFMVAIAVLLTFPIVATESASAEEMRLARQISEQGNVEWKNLMKLEPQAKILDVAVSADGSLVFGLTKKAILIFTTADQKMIDRIPVDQRYETIVFSNPDRLVLTSKKPPLINIIQYSRIYDIDISGRPFKGGADASVVLVVFDDYQ